MVLRNNQQTFYTTPTRYVGLVELFAGTKHEGFIK